ncbi:U2 snRNP-associated SURP motif-containing protein isoform X2 [Planococcus citri]|uniref:U2 snRNP-associated SURP motif-containing protein isoform X2 n=1 Tax=Planococcus citri TaxID=170843 RepID=UPI0031FA4020
MNEKTMKKIADQKLKAFSIGSMGNRSMSKRELEEMKKKEQEQAAAQAFQEFIADFEEAPSNKVNKTWIKAGTYDAGRRQEDSKDRGKIYRPTPKIETEKSSAVRAEEYAKQLSEKRPEKPKKKKEGEKKKTNLELFKEELKMIQEEREERHKYKGAMKSTFEEPELSKDGKLGSFDNGDPNTTNLYLGNLNPKITEQQLMEVFGKYGPLASIKIMWPRSDEEKARGRNCGFVAYMSRKDGERALRCLNGKDVMQYEMKLGWGKGVPIPPFPIYIPPKLLAMTMPPPPSGLPFNAQPLTRDKHRLPKSRSGELLCPEDEERMNKVLNQAIVKVVVPTDRNLLMLVHHMIEFVIREGPMFEAMIMNKEINNPMFRFLFENQSPAHIYYRWKLFSMLQGDSPREWRTDEFRMFNGGSIWKPPPMNPFINGMPDELVEDDVDVRKGSLSVTQRERLEDLLRNITPERLKVAEGMVFCIEHADAAEEICECILESLSSLSTALYKKVGRLYLVSDILHNCGVKISNASFFRRALETRLLKIFEETRKTYENIESRIKAEGFRTRVMQILKAWSDWAIYPKEFLIKIQNTFLGLSPYHGYEGSDSENDDRIAGSDYGCKVPDDSELDGAPLSEGNDGEDLDGIPLDGAALLKGALKHKYPMMRSVVHDDIDGVPLDDDLDGVPLEDDTPYHKQKPKIDRSAAFVPSKWESVDPEEAEAQAMTTSKWELLEQQNAMSAATSQDSQDSQRDVGDYPADDGLDSSFNREDRRAKLREIEVKVMQYQDELESGKRSLKGGTSIHQQVEHYRRKLLRKAEKVERTEPDKKDDKRGKRSPSYDDYSSNSKRSRRSRSYSASPSPGSKRSHRSRSSTRSPTYKSQKDWSPGYRSSSKRVRGYSPNSPRYKRESPVSKRRAASPNSPQSHKRRQMSPESPGPRSRHGGPSGSPSRGRYNRSRRSESYSPPRYRHGRGYSPASPRKHKHKHKY